MSPGALSATISHALTSYGAEAVAIERRRRQQGQSQSEDGELRLGVTALLVGTGAGGVRLADSLQSILRGLHSANARLAAAREPVKAGAGGRQHLIARIASIDICELFEDLSIRAVIELNNLALVSEFKSDFVFDNVLVPGKGGEQRAIFDEAPGWWQRIRISRQPSGELKFESLTERARVEAALLPTQQVMVRGLLDRAIGSTATDLDLCGTLFELLVPQRLKEHAPDRRPLVLLVDDTSAVLPWELMSPTVEIGSKPVSVDTGMIRQLVTSDFRSRVARAPKDTALVIGDPPLEGSTVFSQLPGAAMEARTVVNSLREKGFETRPPSSDLKPIGLRCSRPCTASRTACSTSQRMACTTTSASRGRRRRPVSFSAAARFSPHPSSIKCAWSPTWSSSIAAISPGTANTVEAFPSPFRSSRPT